jgi:isocitrate/isopropylmalate dehydrogenase
MANEKKDPKKSTGGEQLTAKETTKEVNQNELYEQIIKQRFGELYSDKTIQELEELDANQLGMMLIEKMKTAFINSNKQLVHIKATLKLFDETNPLIMAIHENEKIIELIDIIENAEKQA